MTLNGWPWPRGSDGRRPGKPTPLLFRQNVLLLLACFLFAIILWMYVAGLDPDQDPGKVSSRDVIVPIRFVQARMPIAEPDMKTATVTVQGPASQLDRVIVRASVALGSIRVPGEHTVPVHVQLSDPDLTATVIPDKVRLFLDSQQTGVLSVAWHSTKHPPPGYVTGEPVIDPDTVGVSGPSSLLSLAHAETEFDLSSITEGVDVMLPVHLTGVPDRYKNLFTIRPPKVRLFLPIHRQVAYATVVVSPRLVGWSANSLVYPRAEATPSTVTVSGPPAIIQSLTAIPTERIDISEASRSFSARVDLAPPAGVRLEGSPTVDVRVEIAPVAVPPHPNLPVAPARSPDRSSGTTSASRSRPSLDNRVIDARPVATMGPQSSALAH